MFLLNLGITSVPYEPSTNPQQFVPVGTENVFERLDEVRVIVSPAATVCVVYT